MVAAVMVFAACGSDAETPPATSQRTSPPIPPPAQVAEETASPDSASEDGIAVAVALQDNGGPGPVIFAPVDLTFNRGDVVNFSFESEAVFHTFTVEGLGIDEAVDGGEVVDFTFTFDKPGTYELVCIPHEALGMVGTITVTDTPSAQAPAPSAPAPAAAAEQAVGLMDGGGSGPFTFSPDELKFSVGDVVDFSFVSEATFHTFTVDELGIDVAVNVGEAAEFSYTFDKPGVYELICIPHEALGMVGTITVQ